MSSLRISPSLKPPRPPRAMSDTHEAATSLAIRLALSSRSIASPALWEAVFVGLYAMTTTNMSSRQFRERLIDEVKKYPVLYDTRHENHRDIDIRDRCWSEISERLGGNSEVLKREWKILRDSMRQALKRTKRGATTKAGAPCKKWRFESRMAFVLPYMTVRRSVLIVLYNTSATLLSAHQARRHHQGRRALQEVALREPHGLRAALHDGQEVSAHRPLQHLSHTTLSAPSAAPPPRPARPARSGASRAAWPSCCPT
ncbi:transcription factor Adf-1-like isoform X1 [Ostrinia furnacalis]|uniref:transcription factor Adf-1-like isoform X1 n=1 Tax=Ostrinia furnacalis TaxID=93504 RepID=UPI00103A8E80|nr:transcription factor Adf-1-like isoform X1 [Ostrinia furnacalis]